MHNCPRNAIQPHFAKPLLQRTSTTRKKRVDLYSKFDKVEKLAYQLNEEAERTERSIRRLSKVMYGSTCADMQVDVKGECLNSIKHVVGTTSGGFYPRSNHREKLEEGRSVTSVAAEFGIAHSIVSRLWRQFQTTGTSIRGFTSGNPRGTTPSDDRYIVLQARSNRRQTAGEIARHTTQATGRPISRFTVATRLHGGGLFARRSIRCVPSTSAHRRRRSLWCWEHWNWRDNEWGRVLFTDESRFSLSSDSHRILICRERGSRNHPSNIIDQVAVFSFGEASCLEVVQTFTSSTQVQSTGPVIVTRFFFHICVLLEVLWVCSRRLAARTLPPVTIRELRLALQDEWAAMPQQLIDTLILSMGRRCQITAAHGSSMVTSEFLPSLESVLEELRQIPYLEITCGNGGRHKNVARDMTSAEVLSSTKKISSCEKRSYRRCREKMQIKRKL
ncbi:transposable element Tcb1 transposase [Trichonephila clavipes]|nr:transposable element Tcb1 transposase [Trichonephila clavipes]